MGAIYKAKKGDKVSSWDDVWIGDTPLKIQFPDLYTFCDDPNVLVEDYYYEDVWEIGLRCVQIVSEAEQRTAMLNLLQEVTLDPFSSYEVERSLDKSKTLQQNCSIGLSLTGVCE
jgi:hypothetical protein